MVRTAVFASGQGSNFQRIAEALANQEAGGFNIAFLLVDKKDAPARRRAEALGIPCIFLDPKSFASKKEFEEEQRRLLLEEGVQFIILAGYMRIISPYLLGHYPRRIINIHPSLLPMFPGKRAIEAAFSAGQRVTGVTIHYVTEDVDMGEIIAQEVLPINPSWSLEQLEKQVHFLEHRLYPQALEKIFRSVE